MILKPNYYLPKLEPNKASSKAKRKPRRTFAERQLRVATCCVSFKQYHKFSIQNVQKILPKSLSEKVARPSYVTLSVLESSITSKSKYLKCP